VAGAFVAGHADRIDEPDVQLAGDQAAGTRPPRVIAMIPFQAAFLVQDCER